MSTTSKEFHCNFALFYNRHNAGRYKRLAKSFSIIFTFSTHSRVANRSFILENVSFNSQNTFTFTVSNAFNNTTKTRDICCSFPWLSQRSQIARNRNERFLTFSLSQIKMFSSQSLYCLANISVAWKNDLNKLILFQQSLYLQLKS